VSCQSSREIGDRAGTRRGVRERFAEPSHDDAEAQNKENCTKSVPLTVVRDGHSEIAQEVVEKGITPRRVIEERAAGVAAHRGDGEQRRQTNHPSSECENGSAVRFSTHDA
jgi:hypothetical protein